MNGFVVFNKPEGITSFRAVGIVKRIYGQKKAGHTGTLDPMAAGVLPVALGRATRFIDFLPDEKKAYTARLRFGLTTDTLDITGRVLTETDCRITAAQVEAVLPAFRGEILQTPPMYSALSVNGERLYALARRGIEVEREARRVRIDGLELTDVSENGEFEIAVFCSKGTYIRSLIDDIGRALGVGAVMTALTRTYSNGFSIAQAATEDRLKADPAAALLKTDLPFSVYPAVAVTEKQAVRFMNGGALFTDRLQASSVGRYRVYAQDKTFLGLGEIRADDPTELAVLRVMSNGE